MSGPRQINIQAHTFKSDLRRIAQAIMQHSRDRDLGDPAGANVSVEDDYFGFITIVWRGGMKANGKVRTYEVTQAVPPRLWEAAKVAGQEAQFVGRCILDVRAELQRLKRQESGGSIGRTATGTG